MRSETRSDKTKIGICLGFTNILFQQYGVEAIHKFSSEPSQVDPGLNIVFILRPNIEYMNLLVQQMKLDLQQKIQGNYRSFFIIIYICLTAVAH